MKDRREELFRGATPDMKMLTMMIVTWSPLRFALAEFYEKLSPLGYMRTRQAEQTLKYAEDLYVEFKASISQMPELFKTVNDAPMAKLIELGIASRAQFGGPRDTVHYRWNSDLFQAVVAAPDLRGFLGRDGFAKFVGRMFLAHIRIVFATRLEETRKDMTNDEADHYLLSAKNPFRSTYGAMFATEVRKVWENPEVFAWLDQELKTTCADFSETQKLLTRKLVRIYFGEDSNARIREVFGQWRAKEILVKRNRLLV